MNKILIVEDIELNIDLLVQLLEDNYDLITAVNGQEGVQKALDEQPDLILMDISLPIMDGFEAMRQIRTHASLKNVPIIAVTAHAMSGDKERVLANGFNEYLSKPVDEDLLLQVVHAYLQSA